MENLKKLAALALSIMMVLSFAGCGAIKDSSSNANSNANSEESGETFGNFENGVFTTDEFTVDLGTNWYINDSISDRETAVFTQGSESGSYSSINIRHENLDKGAEIDTEQYKEGAIKQYNSMDGYKVTNSESVDIDGRDAFKLYINMNTGSQKMKMIQFYVIDDTNIFTFSFLTSKEEYKEMEPQAEKILETFKFKK